MEKKLQQDRRKQEQFVLEEMMKLKGMKKQGESVSKIYRAKKNKHIQEQERNYELVKSYLHQKNNISKEMYREITENRK